MSWIVYADGEILARSGIADPSFAIASPEVKIELNKAGSFNFTIYPMHPYYNRLIKMKTKIDVVLNGENIFSGRVLYFQTDMYKQRKVYCEGCLAYLLDSVQESYEFNSKVTQFYDMTVYEFLDRLLVRHDKMFITDRMGVLDNFQNALTDIGIPEGNTDTTERLYKALKVYNNKSSQDPNVYYIDDTTKLFKIGTVNAEGTADRFKFEIKGHKKTLDMILETLVDTVGGFMRAYRDTDGWYILEWRDKFGNENMQPIEFGSNLIELQQDESGVETFTRLYPSGKPSSSSTTGTSTADKTICLRETQMYFPIPESMIVYDDDNPYDKHQPGTEITVPKNSNFCDKVNDSYVTTQDTEPDVNKLYSVNTATGEVDQTVTRTEGHIVYSGYYLPIYGDPMTLKVDDILNYAQVYMGEFNAISVRIDALALNGNVDITTYPVFSASSMKIYDYPDGTALVTLMDQNGDPYQDSDTYMESVRTAAGTSDKLKSKDTEHRIIHVITGNAQVYHNLVVDIPATANPHDLGYYEYNNGSFVITSDTSPVDNKSYYAHSMASFISKIVQYSTDWYDAVDEYFPDGATPASLGYFEVQQYGYVATSDTRVVKNKNYYYLRDNPVHNEEKYGVIVRAVEFSDVNGVNEEAQQHALYKKAVDYIQKNCTDLPEQITLTAIDLKNLDTSIEQMSIGRDIHVKSEPHDIDRHMKCISIDYYLDAPEKNVYVISSKPTGSDAIPKFTEQAETKKKKGSGGSGEAGGGAGGIGGGGGDDDQQEEIDTLKNHVYYSYGNQGDATMYGSYNQFYAKALGMRIDENGNPVLDIEGRWAWDGVTDSETPRNTVISYLDTKPDGGSLISEINAAYVQIVPSQWPGASPKDEDWLEFKSNIKWPMTEDETYNSSKTYYDNNHQPIVDPQSKVGDVYTAIVNTSGKNPSEEGWYEKSGNDYNLTTDTTPQAGKTYYKKTTNTPKSLRWREKKEVGNYSPSRDTSIQNDKEYYRKLPEGEQRILSSRVEVHPDTVLIESLNRPTYTKVPSDQVEGKDPKAEGWYEYTNSAYTRTQDRTPVSGKSYYTRAVVASGAIEVHPGDILIEAINKNNDSSVKIAANQITLKGNTTVDGLLKIQDNALIVDGGGINVNRKGVLGGGISAYSLDTDPNGHVLIGTGGYLRFLGSGTQDFCDVNATTAKSVVYSIELEEDENNPGTYSLYKTSIGDNSRVLIGTFNRASASVSSVVVRANGTYNTQSGGVELPVTVNLTSGSPVTNKSVSIMPANLPISAKIIDSNGSYPASDDEKIGYSTVTVAVDFDGDDVDLNGDSSSTPSSSRPSTLPTKSKTMISGYVWGKLSDGKWHKLRAFSFTNGATKEERGLWTKDLSGNYVSLSAGLYYS